MSHNVAWSLIVAALLLTAFFLGLPQMHYTVAIMVAVILRYKDEPLDQPLFRFTYARS